MTIRELILASYDSNIREAKTEAARKFYRRERAGYLRRARARDEQQKPKTRTGPNWDRHIENETV